MRVNHKDEPVVERQLFVLWDTKATHDEVCTAIMLILEHLQMRCVVTNATKHGNVEMCLKEREQ